MFFITPLPVLYYLRTSAGEKGTRIIIRSSVISGLLAMIMGALPVLLFSFTLVPIGFILAASLRKEESHWAAGLKALVFVAATWFMAGMLVSSTQHINIYSSILQEIDQNLVAALEAYKTSAKIPTATLEEVGNAFTELRRLVPRIFPGVILMTIISTVWLNMVFGDWLLKRTGKAYSNWQDFRTWKLPEQMVWGVITAGVFLFISSSLFNTIGLNLLMILGLLYFFQGLAVVTFLLARWSVPRTVKFFLFMLLIVQAYGMILLAILGLADVWLNFRKPRPDDGRTGDTTQ